VTLIHVIRHGRTALNAAGRFRGLADPPLDEAGLAEVAGTAEGLRGHAVAWIATSRLQRACETAEAVARVVGVEPVVDPGLLDVDMGAWEGLTKDEAAARDPGAFAVYTENPRAATVPDGDALADVEARVLGAVASLAAAHTGGEVVAVSHEAPIKLLVSGLLGLDGADVWSLDLATASRTTIRIDGTGWRIAP
jgi:broad specificity phosphatase PhoE